VVYGGINLNVRGDNIYGDQARFIANELKSNMGVTSVDLSISFGNILATNNIKADGARWIAKMLRSNQSLLTLKLGTLLASL
jgi:hypothetical protein